METRSFNTVQISRSALEHNYSFLRNQTHGNVPVMAMVKADGYGHGMVEVADTLREIGCSKFGVAEMREALLLRGAGIAGDIFVTIGFAPEEAELFFKYKLTPVVYSLENVKCLSQMASSHGEDIGIHIKVDTGMGRLGIFPDDVLAFAEAASQMKGIRIDGLMSHFPGSDDRKSATTSDGFSKFNTVCERLKKRYGVICHIANSGAVLSFADTHCDMVRAGIALYGYHPAGKVVENDQPVDLIPAMSFTTKVLQVKNMAAGTGISYGHTFITKKPTKIAVLPVGYEDGYHRALSNKGYVLIHGEMAPVCGRVCMNMCMVDVSSINKVQPGDEVVLLGRQGNKTITADDLAHHVGSISYEMLCHLGNNNSRKYTE